MGVRTLAGVAAIAAAAASASATVITDDFSSATLNPMWTLRDDPANYGPGGGFVTDPTNGYVIFNDVWTEAYANIQTPIDASSGARLDAVMRTNHYGTARWNMSTTIYFDNNNWASLKIGDAGGQYGWVKETMVNGVLTDQTSDTNGMDLRWWFLVGGVELTDTEVKFWGSQTQPTTDHYGETNIDASLSVIPEFTIPRPASFFGQAKAIIGKGFSYDAWGFTNPDMANNAANWNDSSVYAYYTAPEYIDFARITTIGGSVGWRLDGSGDWNVADNWNGGVPNAVDAIANFGTVITSAQTVSTSIPVTVGALAFDNANSYEIAGTGSLTIDVSAGAGSISVFQGSHKLNLPVLVNDNTTADIAAGATLTISQPLAVAAGNTLTKTGVGALVIAAPVQDAGAAGIAVDGGHALLNSSVGTAATAASAAAAPLAITVNNGKVSLGANQVMRGLSAATDNAGDQEIDLAGHSAQVYSANASAAEQGIYNAIKAARLSASGKDGIYDSTIASSNYAVGVTDQAIDAHGDHLVVVKKTILGDANVDGTVDVIDLGMLATGWQTSGLWDNGDSNFDGFIDVIDLGMLATNWQQSAGGPSLGEALAAYGLPSVSVPEPASLGLIGLMGAAVLSRKRRI